MNGVAKHFPAEMHLDCMLLHIPSQISSRSNTPGTAEAPSMLEPGTSFRLDRQRSHCCRFTKRPPAGHHAHLQWCRNEFESGGGVPIRREASDFFWSYPSKFLAVKVQLVVLVNAFVMVSTVWSVSCLRSSTHGDPVPSHS